MVIIKISNLSKDYGKNRVLDNVSLTIEENKIYGLLGRNGAGKTTLLNLMVKGVPFFHKLGKNSSKWNWGSQSKRN